MRTLAIVLGALIVMVQYPLWLGRGGWLKVSDMERSVSGEQARNRRLETRNNALAAEVRDLKQGVEAIEERARYELGLVKKDEVFFHIVEGDVASGPGEAAPAPAPAAPGNAR